MKVLVTGHKGFIGQNMVKHLEAKNIEWVGYEWGEPDYSLNGIDRVIQEFSSRSDDIGWPRIWSLITLGYFIEQAQSVRSDKQLMSIM